MVDDEIDDDADAETLGVLHGRHEVPERAMLVVDAVVIGDVVSVVPVRRWVKGLKPDARYAETLKIVEPTHEAFEIANTVVIGVLILLDVQAVENRVLVPEIGNR